MRTPVCDLLGIDVPIFQAAIGGISCPELAAAVSNAGGLGSIALTGWGAAGARQKLRESAALTDRGIVANLLLSYDIADEFAAILADPPKMVCFFWGEIDRYVEAVHDVGSLVMASVGSVEEADRAVAAGADVVVAQGWEAGGHVRGATAAMALLPAVVDRVDPVPVIAAGGIADGRGLAASLCLGAQGAWMGTRFLVADEADIHPHYRERVLAAETSDTLHSVVFDGGWEGAPGRALLNETTSAWEAAGRPPRGRRPGEGEVIVRDAGGNPIHRYDAVAMRSEMVGNIEAAPLWAGQGVGLVSRSEPAAAIVEALVREATAVLDGLQPLVKPE